MNWMYFVIIILGSSGLGGAVTVTWLSEYQPIWWKIYLSIGCLVALCCVLYTATNIDF